ncbi:MAG: Ig-like domain-containing protein [Candidatus Nanoarchaeia archaeon]|nr:Ig-like domain-containing protein [Candidatus Nanoarchaeia archaeon]
MVSIKKDLDITILVLGLFILSFFVFLFIKPNMTGMATISPLSINAINVGSSLSNNIILNFVAGTEIQPCDSTLIVNISNSSGGQIYLITKTLQDFVTSAGAACVGGNFVASVPTLTSSISVFGIGTFSTVGTYNFELNFSNSSGLVDMKTTTFNVNALPTDILKPQITDIIFKNENGSINFMRTQRINCSALVKDEDSSSVTVTAILYGSNVSKTSITNPGLIQVMICTGDSWVTGKTCLVNSKVEKSDLSYWNCTIEANDGTNKNYSNSSVMLMVNSPPRLKKEFGNITINKNENNSDLDMDSYFEDPDEQNLNYSYSGNNHISILIKSNGNIILTPDTNWTGIENITFKATDEKNAENSSIAYISVVNLFNCTSSWSCTNWSSCTNNIQTRTCIDTNNCSYSTSFQPTTQNCTNIPTPTCMAGDGCMIGCIDGDPDCTCDQQQGYICGSSQNCTTPIIHSGSSVCCSVPCLSILTSNNKVGSGTFLGIETGKILIGFGTIAGVVFVTILIIILSTFIKKKKAVVVEEKPTIIAQEEKVLDTTPVKIKPTNSDKMKDYINQSLATKVPMRVIKAELEKVGWTESDIDKELNLARLRNYIQIKLNQGVPRAEIEQSLKMKGWTKEQIDDAAKNTKVRPLL